MKKEDKKVKAKGGEGKKNPAIKTDNPAFKPTKNVGNLIKGNKGKLDTRMWRGSSKGK